nr:putative XRE family transcriptional regulator [uncultured bacterium]
MPNDKPQALSFGNQLKYWRKVANQSQLDLALSCDTSSRHLSCVETERAHPSRHLLLRLCSALEIPLRVRNNILISAGYSPIYEETGLSEPEMAEARVVFEKILNLNNPYPAMLLDRNMDILMCNEGFDSFARFFVKDQSILEEGNWNLLYLLFDPRGMASNITNLESAYTTMTERAKRNLIVGSSDRLTAILDDIAQYRPAEDLSNKPNIAQLIMPLHLKKNDVELDLFTMSATMGVPLNLTLQELHLECGYAVNEAGEQALRKIYEKMAN